MAFIQTFILAILIAFIGFIPPGMINMTALKRSLDLNRREGIHFVLGAVSVITIQAFIAATFAKFLVANPTIIDNLSIAAIFVFLALSILFFSQARREVKMKERKFKRGSFKAGLVMASMNMLGIPFFLGYATIMEAEGFLHLIAPHNLIFALGAGTGAFLLFYSYVLLAKIIQARLQIVAKNINMILGILFLTLAALAAYNTLF